eukprot:scaffold78382_cov17-Tisochrysis_lutea.AAC.1
MRRSRLCASKGTLIRAMLNNEGDFSNLCTVRTEKDTNVLTHACLHMLAHGKLPMWLLETHLVSGMAASGPQQCHPASEELALRFEV